MPARPNRLQSRAADLTSTIDEAITMEGHRYLFSQQPLFVGIVSAQSFLDTELVIIMQLS
jgi:hypothetical protein